METQVLPEQTKTVSDVDNADGAVDASGNAERARLRPRFGSDGGDGEEVFSPPPRTAVVLAVLAGTALTFSYLGAYAVAGALVRAEVLAPWPAESDPRPMWLIQGFFGLLGAFVLVAGLTKLMSRRDLRRIDAMAEEA